MDSVRDRSFFERYALRVPALALVNMSPNQLAIYAVYLRECDATGGSCALGLRTIAKRAGMSVTTSRPARQWLIDNNWLKPNGTAPRGRLIVSIVDRWADNEEYAQRDIEKRDAKIRRRQAKIAHSKAVRAKIAQNYAPIFVTIGRRDGFSCALCGSAGEDLQIDHVMPVSAGGTSDLENLQLLCRACNSAKGARVNHE